MFIRMCCNFVCGPILNADFDEFFFNWHFFKSAYRTLFLTYDGEFTVARRTLLRNRCSISMLELKSNTKGGCRTAKQALNILVA